LILYGASARYRLSDDYPIGTRPELIERTCAEVEANWGTGVMFGALCPSAKNNGTLRADYARLQRLSASPGAAAAYLRDLTQMDVRDALPLITAPTLVVHARGDRTDPIARARYMAARIPGARMVELDSEDHLIWLTSALDRLIEEIQAFVDDNESSRSQPAAPIPIG
jgi:pimeloyl-ACP methyl ester carboxylesterase